MFSGSGSSWHLRVPTWVVDIRHVRTSTFVDGICICFVKMFMSGACVWQMRVLSVILRLGCDGVPIDLICVGPLSAHCANSRAGHWGMHITKANAVTLNVLSSGVHAGQ